MCCFPVVSAVIISIHSLRMEGDTLSVGTSRSAAKFQSTPSAWRETPAKWHHQAFFDISIHSLRMEGDCLPPRRFPRGNHFNPLPPHGGRHPALVAFALKSLFQSTPSAWRETPFSDHCQSHMWNFNPLPPHGGRRKGAYVQEYSPLFQSTPSAWRETAEC